MKHFILSETENSVKVVTVYEVGKRKDVIHVEQRKLIGGNHTVVESCCLLGDNFTVPVEKTDVLTRPTIVSGASSKANSKVCVTFLPIGVIIKPMQPASKLDRVDGQPTVGGKGGQLVSGDDSCWVNQVSVLVVDCLPDDHLKG